MNRKNSRRNYYQLRIRFGFVFVFLGLIIFLMGENPENFGMDRSPVIGFGQIGVFLVWLAMISPGGFISFNTLWNGKQKSIVADIGFRLVSTGFVIAVAAGLADIFGLGNHPFPQVPVFGPWQAAGVIIGEVIIAIGFLMLIPWPRKSD